MKISGAVLLTAGCIVLHALAGCTDTGRRPLAAGDGPAARTAPTAVVAPPPAAAADEPAVPVLPLPAARRTAAPDEVHRGSGRFVGTPAPPTPAAAADGTAGGEGDITLNFENAEIREVVKTILGDLLHRNYAVDPRVQGQVTLQTSRALGRDGLLPLLELLLEMHGAVLVHSGDLYQIMPDADAVQSLQTPRVGYADGSGYQLVVAPLRYISAADMKKILQPLASKDGVLQVDAARNLLLLSGSERELKRLLDTIRIFDVDWMAGMSVGLFTLQYADARTLAVELEAVLGQSGAADDGRMVRLIPIERLNGLLVITPQPAYLGTAQRWIEQLDRAGDSAGRRLFVYPVQNSKAEHLADILNDLLLDRGSAAPARQPPRLAPGLRPVTLESPPANGTPAEPPLAGPAADAAAPATGNGARIIADQQKNALVILATPAEHESILAALRKLDTVPLQVLVEATIIEVQLTGDLSYGVEWFFKNNDVLDNKSGLGRLDFGQAGLAPLVPGFSYSLVTDAADIRAVLNILESESEIDIVSSPSLLVLDNQPAQIRVGDQVPVRTSESTSLSTSGDAPIVTSTIEFRDTGVLLNVLPRVNTGGLVIMEINEEVSTVDRTTTSGIDSPTINQRAISTTVWVQSGQTIVLGGLIRNDRSLRKSGVPGLHRIPVMGALFGQTDRTSDRTELLVMITPRVVGDDSEARAITDEYRNKLKHIAWPPAMRKP